MPIGKTRGESRTIAFMEKRAHILVVDDEQAITDLVVNLLAAEGMDALACYSGQAALDMLARTPFDLAIVDIMMPVMDGLAATKAIRSLNRPDAGTVPIIAMTAKAFVDDRQKSFAAGMNEHLAKPLDDEKIKQTISEELRKQNACHK